MPTVLSLLYHNFLVQLFWTILHWILSLSMRMVFTSFYFPKKERSVLKTPKCKSNLYWNQEQVDFFVFKPYFNWPHHIYKKLKVKGTKLQSKFTLCSCSRFFHYYNTRHYLLLKLEKYAPTLPILITNSRCNQLKSIVLKGG